MGKLCLTKLTSFEHYQSMRLCHVQIILRGAGDVAAWHDAAVAELQVAEDMSKESFTSGLRSVYMDLWMALRRIQSLGKIHLVTDLNEKRRGPFDDAAEWSRKFVGAYAICNANYTGYRFLLAIKRKQGRIEHDERLIEEVSLWRDALHNVKIIMNCLGRSNWFSLKKYAD